MLLLLNEQLKCKYMLNYTEDTNNEEQPRDERYLSYAELMEDYVKFNKKRIMLPETFERLWNS